MKIQDFKIGEIFYGSGGFPYLCTDIGSRTISAIPVPLETYSKFEFQNIEFWLKGPPYMVKEETLNEREIEKCFRNFEEDIKNALECHDKKRDYQNSYTTPEVNRMMKAKSIMKNNRYRSELIRYNRISNEGECLHPYDFILNEKENIDLILFLNMHTRNFEEMNIQKWIGLSLEK